MIGYDMVRAIGCEGQCSVTIDKVCMSERLSILVSFVCVCDCCVQKKK